MAMPVDSDFPPCLGKGLSQGANEDMTCCTNCGKEIADGNRFCGVCGRPAQQDALVPTTAKDLEIEIACANEVRFVEMMRQVREHQHLAHARPAGVPELGLLGQAPQELFVLLSAVAPHDAAQCCI